MSGLIPASAFHAATMAGIHAGAFPPGEQWSAEAIGVQLAQPGAYGFLHPRGAMVLARVAADEAEILTIATIPSSRRQGFGRELLLAAQASAALAGAGAMFLEVSEVNHAARELYAVLGYRAVGRRPHYYGKAAALCLRLDLGTSIA